MTSRRRLVAWAALVLAIALAGYAGRAGTSDGSVLPPDTMYRYETAASAAIGFSVLLLLTYLISIRAPKREIFALRAPASWGRALRLAAIAIGATYAASIVFVLAGADPSEQSVPAQAWDPARAGPFVLNVLIVAVAVPIVEELLFRGLGFSLLERFGQKAAIVASAIAFALAHGVIGAFPFILAFGLGLGYLRSETRSVFPAIFAHGVFNAVATVLSVVAFTNA